MTVKIRMSNREIRNKCECSNFRRERLETNLCFGHFPKIRKFGHCFEFRNSHFELWLLAQNHPRQGEIESQRKEISHSQRHRPGRDFRIEFQAMEERRNSETEQAGRRQ